MSGPAATLMARLRLAHDVARNLGTATALRVGVPWLIRRTYLVGARDLRGALPDVPDTPGIAWGDLTRADHPAVAQLCRTIPEKELHRRRDEGLECRGGWVNGELVYCRSETAEETYLPYLGRRLCPALGLRRARERGFLRSAGLAAWWGRSATGTSE